MPGWHDVGQLHRTLAEAVPEDVAPHVVGFRGEDLLAIVRLRPFGPGAYHDPLIEAYAFLLPLGADRVSVGMPARAWSLDDPVVPVTADGDLRQRVISETRVDGHDRRPAGVVTLLHPFDLDGDTVRWDPCVDMGPGEGWIPQALQVLVDDRAHTGAGDAGGWTVADQAARLDARGHGLHLSAAGGALLLARSGVP